jgi:hypothetical protein
VVAVAVGERAWLVKRVDPRTFGFRGDYSRDLAYLQTPVEVQCGKRGYKRTVTLTLPPPVLSGEYRGGNVG